MIEKKRLEGYLLPSVKNANFERVVELHDKKYAEVKVEIEGEQKPFLALFEKTNDEQLHMDKLYRLDIDYELDWYENNLHQAYVDVTDRLFDHEFADTEKMTRNSFNEDVLGHGQVRQEVERGLQFH
jgi:hypothetical protein